jgi:hypothetical protein
MRSRAGFDETTRQYDDKEYISNQILKLTILLGLLLLVTIKGIALPRSVSVQSTTSKRNEIMNTYTLGLGQLSDCGTNQTSTRNIADQDTIRQSKANGCAYRISLALAWLSGLPFAAR